MMKDDLDTAARTVVGEAASEPYQGQVAVAWVVRTRVEHEHIHWWGHGWRGVCLASAQFSCWDDPRGSRRISQLSLNDAELVRAYGVVAGVMCGDIRNPIPGATHYHRFDCSPVWANSSKMTYLGKIENHLFYREDP